MRPDVWSSRRSYTHQPTAEIRSLDPRQGRMLTDNVLQPDVERIEGVRLIRSYRTTRSGLAVAAGIDHDVDEKFATHARTKVEDHRAYVVFEVEAPTGRAVRSPSGWPTTTAPPMRRTWPTAPDSRCTELAPAGTRPCAVTTSATSQTSGSAAT